VRRRIGKGIEKCKIGIEDNLFEYELMTIFWREDGWEIESERENCIYNDRR
jgi:hypothetical protein